jgi:hypothetical protein
MLSRFGYIAVRTPLMSQRLQFALFLVFRHLQVPPPLHIREQFQGPPGPLLKRRTRCNLCCALPWAGSRTRACPGVKAMEQKRAAQFLVGELLWEERPSSSPALESRGIGNGWFVSGSLAFGGADAEKEIPIINGLHVATNDLYNLKRR